VRVELDVSEASARALGDADGLDASAVEEGVPQLLLARAGRQVAHKDHARLVGEGALGGGGGGGGGGVCEPDAARAALLPHGGGGGVRGIGRLELEPRETARRSGGAASAGDGERRSDGLEQRQQARSALRLCHCRGHVEQQGGRVWRGARQVCRPRGALCEARGSRLARAGEEAALEEAAEGILEDLRDPGRTCRGRV